MNVKYSRAALRAAGLILLGLTAVSEAADTLSEAITGGKTGVELRYRLERVDQDPFAQDATASTLRARLNYATDDYRGLVFFVEFDYVAEVFADEYNAGAGNTPNRGQYPVVADPEGADLNQAYLQYSSGGTTFKAGRQRIVMDNARFIGDVGWRQNPQTYDGFSFAHSGDKGLAFTLGYIAHANRIFGDDVPAGDHKHSSTLLNVSKNFDGAGKLTAYHYGIDNEDAPSDSNRTIGARFDGVRKYGDRSFGYTLEFATQSEHGDNPVDYDADYFRVDLSAGFKSATVFGGFESLEGDASTAGQAFRTPLATLHAFNGWADQFLSTPGAGLEDTWVGVRGNLGAWSWNLLYHDFAAQSGSADFGSELDASFSRKLGDHYGLLLKFADFDTDSAAYGDNRKFWVQLTASF